MFKKNLKFEDKVKYHLLIFSNKKRYATKINFFKSKRIGGNYVKIITSFLSKINI
jgi:hypothetical protein